MSVAPVRPIARVSSCAHHVTTEEQDTKQIKDYVQRNGQRIYGGPPPQWTGPVPGKGCEVYVTKIPRDCFEDELLPIFEKVGPVYEHRLMMEFTGNNRGYGYVRYGSAEHAKDAIRHLNNVEVRPHRFLVVTKSVDNRRLWVNGIPKNRSAKEIRGEMEKLTAGVTDIILYPSQADKTKSRGYMFVEYESHRAAALARRKMVPGKIFLFGVELGQVDWAEPEHEVDEETMKTVKILFVRNLMLSTSENALRDLFNRLGEGQVERVKKTKDYAFVHFSTREAAEAAMEGCQVIKIEGAEVEVSWSKPVDKQIYNTRKTLTKAFTSGMSGMDIEIGQGSQFPRDMFPRRRGAAGIRGLGAPGTAPPRQLVQKYAAMAASSSVNNGVNKNMNLPHSVTTYRPAPDLLQEICNNNQWGDPIYQLQSSSDEASGELMYLYKVVVPNFPVPSPNNAFQSCNWKPTVDDAKIEAAQFILACLRITPEYVAAVMKPSYETPLVSPMYPVSSMQGMPLTAGWTGLSYPPPTIYQRIAYTDLVASMYGITIR